MLALILIALCVSIPFAQRTPPVVLDRSDFIMILEWFGDETKPVLRAGLATASRKDDLRRWQDNDTVFHRTAIISGPEVASIESLFSTQNFLTKPGTYDTSRNVQEYVVLIHSDGRDYHCILGFSRKILPKLELLKNVLRKDSRRNIQMIINGVRSWKH